MARGHPRPGNAARWWWPFVLLAWALIYGVLLVFVMVRCPQGLLAGLHQLFDKLSGGARRRAGSNA